MQPDLPPKAITIWRELRGIEATGAHEKWEHEHQGGKKRRHSDLQGELARLLGLKPWESMPSDADMESELPAADDDEGWGGPAVGRTAQFKRASRVQAWQLAKLLDKAITPKRATQKQKSTSR